MLDGGRIRYPPVCGWERSRSMGKTKKRPVKKRSAKAKARGWAKKSAKKLSVKKTKKKTVKKKSVAKAKTKAAPKKKPTKLSTSAKTVAPAAQKPARPFLDEEPKKTALPKPVPPVMPKVPDLDDEEIVDEEIEIGAEGELDEDDMEEELALDDDEEDVDYLEKSGDLLDDSDDYRH
jgi:hypothetical protein